MRLKTTLLVSCVATLALTSTFGCKNEDTKPDAVPAETAAATQTTQGAVKEASPESQPASESQSAAESQSAEKAAPSEAWVKTRAEESRKRLAAAGEPGALIAAAIKKHGGLEKWYANGPLEFRFRYAPVGGKKVRDSVQTIDTWRSLAVHHAPDNAENKFGWDGEKAWKTYDDEAINPRFWSLTPYYFVAVPFVFADKGVKLAEAGEITFEDRTYDLVKATFEAGTGDAPDDYYIVYIDRETKAVGGVRYVVSYPGFFPDGGHSPEKFMKYDGAQTVDGITFAKTFRTFKWDVEGNKPLELATNSEMSQVSFKPELPLSFFAIPEDATVIEGMK
jgi:hypothetical protein